MTTPAAGGIPPVFVLSTGRCGASMISDVLNLHPRLLSLSGFISFTGIRTFRFARMGGERMWNILSRQLSGTRFTLGRDHDEPLHPYDEANARCTGSDLPPVLRAAFSQLTDRHATWFDDIGSVVRNQPRQPPADHFRALFGWLSQRFGCETWVERSVGSLLFGSVLLREFPEARVIHVFRDGRETAISMSSHCLFRFITANLAALQPLGFDAMKAIARGRYWEGCSMLLEPVARCLFKSGLTRYDRLTLADFGALWSAMVERGERLFADLPSDRLLKVRLEDVLAAPGPELRRLIRFIDPALEDETWLAEAATVPQPTASKFKRLKPAEQAALSAACRPGLERLGYPL